MMRSFPALGHLAAMLPAAQANECEDAAGRAMMSACAQQTYAASEADLLRVLERPDVPLHTNGSENDIRCQVTRRKISAGTRSDNGRDCRDAFLSLMKTCDKLGRSYWHYLGDRLLVPGTPQIPPLPRLVRDAAVTT